MKNWKPTLLIALLVGIVSSAVCLVFVPELSTISMLLMKLSIGLGFYLVWDFALLKHVSTYDQIVNNRNVAYAILMAIPALLYLGASIV